MNPVRLQGDGVEKRFGRIVALRGIDFTIESGESVSILGANGAGKSTLLRILAGLSRPSAGQLKAQTIGADSELTRDRLRGAVGYVGHQTLVYAELSARENLDFAARLHGRTPNREQVDRVLDGVALLDVADRRAGTFSRGMAQRLSIARAIIHEPTILLLDEPFTGLDETSAERLSGQLATLRDGGRSIVLVTHDPRRAVELSNRALILHRGEIRATPARATPSRAVPADGTPANDANGADAFELAALRETLTRLASGSASERAA